MYVFVVDMCLYVTSCRATLSLWVNKSWPSNIFHLDLRNFTPVFRYR